MRLGKASDVLYKRIVSTAITKQQLTRVNRNEIALRDQHDSTKIKQLYEM